MRVLHKLLMGAAGIALVSAMTALHGGILTAGHIVGLLGGWLFGALFLFSVVLYAREWRTVLGWTLISVGVLIWGLPLSASALAAYGQDYAEPERRAVAEAMLPLRGTLFPGLVGMVCVLPGMFLTAHAIRAKMAEESLTEEAQRLHDPDAGRAGKGPVHPMLRRTER